MATLGGEAGVLPVDISLSADDRTLFVSCFGDGKCRVFDVSNPHRPKQIHEKTIGRQVNMEKPRPDGELKKVSPSELTAARMRPPSAGGCDARD